MIQLQAINKAIADGDMRWIIDAGMDAEYFQDYPDEFKFILDHFREYGSVPSQATMASKFPDFSLLEVREPHSYLISKLSEEYLYSKLVPILKSGADAMQDDSNKALEAMLPQLQSLMSISGGVSDAYNIADKAEDRLNAVDERLQNPEDFDAIPTGLELVDELTGGMLKGEDLWSIVGRPGTGKSWVMHKILANCWQAGRGVLLYSGEMSAQQVGNRIDVLTSHVNISRFRDADWSQKELDEYSDHIESMVNSKTPFNVVTPDSIGGRWLTVDRLEGLIIKYRPEVIGIDQLSLMDDPSMKNEPNRIKFAKISADLFKLSTKYGVPILLNVQSNRQGAGQLNRITLENIAESDGVGQNASRVVTIGRDLDNGTLSLHIVKNRYGKDGKTVEYHWDIETGTFTLIGYADEDNGNPPASVKEAFNALANSDARKAFSF